LANQFEKVESERGVTEWKHRGNGLLVLVAPTPVAPVVGFGVVYRVGSRHEVSGHTGATHILEHLMFKGTQRYNSERGTEIARQLHRVGAAFNATTWLDRTNYYEILPVDRLQLAVDIESDRMRGALVRDSDLDSERTVVLNELDSGENDPFDLLMKSSFAHAFIEHPYHHPTIGWRGDVERINGEILTSTRRPPSKRWSVDSAPCNRRPAHFPGRPSARACSGASGASRCTAPASLARSP